MACDFQLWREIADKPFVLIEFEGSFRLYRCGEIFRAKRLEEVQPMLDQLRSKDAVGFLAYEAGFALEPKLTSGSVSGESPLLWFMAGGTSEEPPPLPDPRSAWASAPSPSIAKEDYLRRVDAIQQHILDGDIYQANFTFQADVRTLGHPLALYAQLRERGAGPWSAVVFTGTQWILSFSPELFFTCRDGLVTCRPMKGTAAAGTDPETLRNDPKQRSENLMIVDLLRNDLSRVARPSSVKVPEMFAVETYPTVLQMTSTIVGQLQDEFGPIDLLKAVFPCGSITGAPKIRAMEIIGELEESPRGIYTGSIGTLSAGGNAAFNVAIRTLVIRDGEETARLGLGSGIVADSQAEAEWEECRQKGTFIKTPPHFRLIETIRIDGTGAIPDLEAHLDRLERSARMLDFYLDRPLLRTSLHGRAQAHGPGKLRLELAANGSVDIETAPLPAMPDIALVAVGQRTTNGRDFRLLHKTSDRAFYDQPRIESGAFELLFTDEHGFLTEGSFTNLFVRRAGRLVTPPLRRRLLPGILRQQLLATGEAVEGDLRAEDLTGDFYVGNALRGLIPARLRSNAPLS